MSLKDYAKLFPRAAEGLDLSTLQGATEFFHKISPSFRYAVNGSRAELRWNMLSVPIRIPADRVPARIADKIQELLDLEAIIPEKKEELPEEPLGEDDPGLSEEEVDELLAESEEEVAKAIEAEIEDSIVEDEELSPEEEHEILHGEEDEPEK